MNAVTSVARDTRNPELKWSLEVIGGTVGTGVANPRAFGLMSESPNRTPESRRDATFVDAAESEVPIDSGQRVRETANAG